MDTSKTLFLTKEQMSKKGNGIIFTDAQLAWFKKLIFGDTTEQIVPQEPVQEINPAVKEQDRHEKYLVDNTTYSIGISRKTLIKLRSYCYYNNIDMKKFFSKLLDDSKILEGYVCPDIGVGRKKEHSSSSPIGTKHKKTYDEMATAGYITRFEAAKILGVNKSCLTDYVKNGLKHIKKGKFLFFKPEDVEKYKSKLLKKKLK